jgi:hypothetical protein
MANFDICGQQRQIFQHWFFEMEESLVRTVVFSTTSWPVEDKIKISRPPRVTEASPNQQVIAMTTRSLGDILQLLRSHRNLV